MPSVSKQLAHLIKATAQLTEESGILPQRNHLGNLQMNKSIHQAARETCGDALWFPVYLLLEHQWNDALHWADNSEAYENESMVGKLGTEAKSSKSSKTKSTTATPS